MSSVVKVGIADLKVGKPPQLLRTTGLGSCVGIVLYDKWKKTAAMAHIMLPDSGLAKGATFHPAKFADTAVNALLQTMTSEGSGIYPLKAKIAGGAQMFQLAAANEMMRIGPRNIEAVKQHLSRIGVDIISEDVGGTFGRTIQFSPLTETLTVRTVNGMTQKI